MISNGNRLDHKKNFFNRFINNDNSYFGKRKLEMDDLMNLLNVNINADSNVNYRKSMRVNNNDSDFYGLNDQRDFNNNNRSSSSLNRNKSLYNLHRDNNTKKKCKSNSFNNFSNVKIIQSVKYSTRNDNTPTSHSKTNFVPLSNTKKNIINMKKAQLGIKERMCVSNNKSQNNKMNKTNRLIESPDDNLKALRNEFFNQLISSKSKYRNQSRDYTQIKDISNFNKNNINIADDNLDDNFENQNNNLQKNPLLTEEEIISKLKLEMEESKRLISKKFAIESLAPTNSVRIEINPLYEEQKFEILKKRIPALLESLNKETQSGANNLGNTTGTFMIHNYKKDFIKNKYKIFLENFE